jgi:hypothetical protein
MKMIVTLEITVEAENRDQAFKIAESKLKVGTEYLLYDAEVADPQKENV